MKVWLLFIFIATGLCSCNTESGHDKPQKSESNGTPVIEFSKLEHDFGKIKEGEKVACVFTFMNSGDNDLLISSATTSCGCTVPEFDNKPVPPGEGGKIEVVFDSSYRNGAQNKTIVIRSNASQQSVVLRIKAEVITNN